MRQRPPDRRKSWLQKVRISGQTFYLSCGNYEDGRLSEIFLDASKEGSFSRGILSSLARMTSIALQCGAEPCDVVKALRHINFPPNGGVEGMGTDVRVCSSVSDWVAQEIENAYVKPAQNSETPVEVPQTGGIRLADQAGADTVFGASKVSEPQGVREWLLKQSQEYADRTRRDVLVIWEPPQRLVSGFRDIIPYFTEYDTASDEEKKTAGAELLKPR